MANFKTIRKFAPEPEVYSAPYNCNISMSFEDCIAYMTKHVGKTKQSREYLATKDKV